MKNIFKNNKFLNLISLIISCILIAFLELVMIFLLLILLYIIYRIFSFSDNSVLRDLLNINFYKILTRSIVFIGILFFILSLFYMIYLLVSKSSEYKKKETYICLINTFTYVPFVVFSFFFISYMTSEQFTIILAMCSLIQLCISISNKLKTPMSNKLLKIYDYLKK